MDSCIAQLYALAITLHVCTGIMGLPNKRPVEQGGRGRVSS